jgi:hypothetical protein
MVVCWFIGNATVEVVTVKRLFSGNRGIFLITLLVLWSVIAIATVVTVIWADPPAAAWIGLLIPMFVAAVLSVAAYLLLGHERPSAALPESERAAPSAGLHRILVIANATLGGSTLHDEVRRRATEKPTEVLVVAPVLSSAVAHWTDAEDAARATAQERLRATCATLGDLGVVANGQVGVDDPLRAVEDALRTFGADEIIVSTHTPDRSNWLEQGVVDQLRRFYDIPVVHVVVDQEHESVRWPEAAPRVK